MEKNYFGLKPWFLPLQLFRRAVNSVFSIIITMKCFFSVYLPPQKKIIVNSLRETIIPRPAI